MNPSHQRPIRRPKLLVITTSREPGFDGDFLRFENIFSRLSKANDLTLLYLDRHKNDSYFNTFARYFSTVERCEYSPLDPSLPRLIDYFTLRPERDIRRRDPKLFSHVRSVISKIVAREGIDLIYSWVREAAQFLHDPRIPVLFDLCDALSLQLKQALGSHTSPQMHIYNLRTYRSEASIVARYPVTFVSQKDSHWFNKRLDATVIPNGVSLDQSGLPADEREPDSIVFSGSMGFPPNVDAVLYFAENVLPILRTRAPGLTWYIVGTNPAPEVLELATRPNIVVTGRVDSVTEYLGRARLVIAPMISGSGIKNKVLEAMALGTPVVSTSLGIDGIDCTPGTDVIVADEPQELATAVVSLLANPARSRAIGEAGRRLVQTRYSWDNAVHHYNHLFARLIAAHRRTANTTQ